MIKTVYPYCFRISRSIAAILILHLSVSFQARSQITPPVADSTELEAVQLLSEYIKFASVTGNEKGGGEFIAEQCLKRGLSVRIFTDSVDSYNFSASLYPLELRKPNIILLSHLDVVSGGEDSGWRYPAFSGAVVGDTVWGRGAIDMKEVTIMHLMAVSAFAERASAEDLPVNITLLCVSGEETYGIQGSKIISETYLPDLDAIVVFGEGGIGTTGLLSKTPEKPVFFISLNDKRALWLELNLNYKTSGHGAVPPPDYATRMMINSLNNLTQANPRIRFDHDNKAMLRAFGEMERGVTGFLLKNPVLFKPLVAGGLRKNPLMLSTMTNTITITRIASEETDINQIPQEVSAFLDCRLLPETSTAWFLDYVSRKLVDTLININIIAETQNAASSATDRFYDLFAEALNETYPGCGIIPVLFPATTDNNYFRNKGLPVFGVVPVILEQELLETIHNYNERLPVDALISGTEVYTRFIEKLLPETFHETDSLTVSELQYTP